jgi:D-arabinose 1-dehydrogenase-like Zn-dependent alcohol dehydrogenase
MYGRSRRGFRYLSRRRRSRSSSIAWRLAPNIERPYVLRGRSFGKPPGGNDALDFNFSSARAKNALGSLDIVSTPTEMSTAVGYAIRSVLGGYVVIIGLANEYGSYTSTSPDKKEDAVRLGADEVVISRNIDEMEKHAESFDFILDTVSAQHDINAYLNLLRRDGNIALVGAPPQPLSVSAFSLIGGRHSLSGAAIGGIAETQEMLDFCGEHNITADVEIIPIQKVNEAYERLLKGDVKYRFSIDMASLKCEQ